MVRDKKPKTQKEALLYVADSIGFYHRPSVYITKVKERYGIDVKNSQVTRSLGTWVNRINIDNDQVKKKCKELLSLVGYDYGLASSCLWVSRKLKG
jgi:hypothetical protein